MFSVQRNSTRDARLVRLCLIRAFHSILALRGFLSFSPLVVSFYSRPLWFPSILALSGFLLFSPLVVSFYSRPSN